MNYYAVLDTNVLVSALLNEFSVPGLILRKIADETIIPLYHPDILEEYADVLQRPKFSFSVQQVNSLINAITQRGISVEPSQRDFPIPDPDDAVFYAVVMEKRSERDAYLITGNIRHFPKEPFVVTPREMLTIIFQNEGSL